MSALVIRLRDERDFMSSPWGVKAIKNKVETNVLEKLREIAAPHLLRTPADRSMPPGPERFISSQERLLRNCDPREVVDFTL